MGDFLLGETRNLGRELVAVVGREQAISFYSKLVQGAVEASGSKIQENHTLNVVTKYLVAFVNSLAVIVPLKDVCVSAEALSYESLRPAMDHVMTILTCACLCASGLAITSAIVAAAGIASQNGLLITKGYDTFQKVNSTQSIVFDKTGTLTNARLDVANLETTQALKKRATELWTYICAVEEHSVTSHPIGRAVFTAGVNHLDGAWSETKVLLESRNIKSESGKGVTGQDAIRDDAEKTFRWLDTYITHLVNVSHYILWASYKTTSNEWAASVTKVGVKSASSVLTGSGAFSAIEWLADTLQEKAKEHMVERVMKSGFDYIAGAHVAKYNDKYRMSARKDFATKVASGFLTVMIAVVGGTLTVVSAGITAAIGTIALLVWIGKENEADKRDRWHEIIDSAMKKYDAIREKRLLEVRKKHITELERIVMSNAYQDLEDAKLMRSYEWKNGNNTFRARYPNKLLVNLWHVLKGMIDGETVKKVWILDVLEVSRVYSEETRDLWHAIEAGKDTMPNRFNKAEIRDFLEFQVESHIEVDRLPVTKAQKALEVLRSGMANDCGEVTKIEDKEEEFKEEHMNEDKGAANNVKVFTTPSNMEGKRNIRYVKKQG
ncbi:hypothetical protein FGADI_7774 [Fusarium gaditjirri]|uniref:Uncharacterized protein n=1 Tax=Fusarium gaditjirri TaxID=282569 RepID=A0A8H4T452_9HYPO|nr:hypothetical protein FGADI_7774 [Fusarium gaditjirri]